MTIFLIVLGSLLITNFLLLQFSCNEISESIAQDEE